MIQRFEVKTFFDCTATGVQNHRRQNDMPHDEWRFRRNQQRNFETILQCISLRCQPLNISDPFVFSESDGKLCWNFSFETEKQDIFLLENDPVGILKNDCNQVPMIVGLEETVKDLFFTPYMITLGKHVNTVFVQN